MQGQAAVLRTELRVALNKNAFVPCWTWMRADGVREAKIALIFITSITVLVQTFCPQTVADMRMPAACMLWSAWQSTRALTPRPSTASSRRLAPQHAASWNRWPRATSQLRLNAWDRSMLLSHLPNLKCCYNEASCVEESKRRKERLLCNRYS